MATTLDGRPLLGETSGGGGDSFQRRDQTAGKYTRRYDAITSGSRYQKAAALVDLAEDGVGIPEQILDQPNFERVAKLYFSYIQFDFIWTLNYFAMIVLNFLEKPLWCQNYSAHACNDRDYFYLGQLPYLTLAESVIYEGVTLLLLIAHIFFPITYEGSHIYWKNPLNQLKVLFLALLVADLLVYALYLSPVAFSLLPFRIAPYIRVFFFILSIRDLQKSILVLGGMIWTYLNVLALGLLFLLFSSWLAYVIFEDTQQGKVVFTSYATTLYQMFILFTTSNNPDVWIPAYKASRWYSLFFVLYVLLGVYFVTNLVLAVVYDSFKGQLVNQVAESDRTRKRILKKAFNLIDKYNAGHLNKEQCIHLFEELNNYRTLPKISSEEFELIFDELDDTHDFKINLDEFADLCNAIALRFQKEDVPSVFEYFHSAYHSEFSEKLKVFVRGPKFGYVVSFILIVNLVAVIIETTLDIQNNSGQKVWQQVEFVFGWIYVLEMALKVYSFGFANYWRDGQNRFDFLVTWIIVIGETITFASPDDSSFLSNGEWYGLAKIFFHDMDLIMIFGGLVNAGNPNLEGTDLAEDDYLLFNFNDYPNGMVTLFNLLVMGNWQVWMESYKDLTGSAWSHIYFISFYLITILLLLNLVIAFVLEAFFAEMDLETSENCKEEDKDANDAKYRRRSVGTKTRSQRVDVLLHHMLSSELNKTECASP
ncbi:Two pore calcium channel protein 1A [Turnera subulata]|uniref:Two pore calcium channel protein 1A n=1 Tax=Turnera subulata TaxID=218843 RepID=A0A9Q0F332_9ROSI|nr:Two pore calcium channel protein 1A [Turnera subulata]